MGLQKDGNGGGKRNKGTLELRKGNGAVEEVKLSIMKFSNSSQSNVSFDACITFVFYRRIT